MNYDELTKMYASDQGIGSKEARRRVRALFNCIEYGLIHDGKVSVHGFGSFFAREEPPRSALIARNLDNDAGFMLRCGLRLTAYTRAKIKEEYILARKTGE